MTTLQVESNINLNCPSLEYHLIIGILAAVRPCGIIVLLAELFRAESKSQVYANLHEFLRKQPNVSENLGMICSIIHNLNTCFNLSP